MAAIVHSDKAKKAIKKIKEAMQDYPLGIEFGELMQKTGYAKSSLYSALSLVGAHKSDDGLWHLPGSQNVVAPVNETAEDDLDDLATAIDQPVKQDDGGNMQDNGGNTQDAPVNMQDEELNTQDPHVSYHDNESSSPDNDEATLINPSAEIANPSAKVDNPSAIDTNTDPDAIINEGVKQISILEEAKDAPYEKLIMPKKPRNKPFTPNPIMGYQVQKGKAKIFLDRRATSKTLTLSLDDLKELVNAVEKSERVA